MPANRPSNEKPRWYVTVDQYSNGRRREPLLLDMQRGSVTEIMEQNGVGLGVAPCYALDWNGPVRQPKSSADWNAVAWQVSQHEAGRACTACQGNRGAFVVCTIGANGEACGSCRLRQRANEDEEDDVKGLREAAKAAACAVEGGVNYVYSRHREHDSESEKAKMMEGESDEEMGDESLEETFETAANGLETMGGSSSTGDDIQPFSSDA
ncbi:hypothetical protein KEM56_003209 [Ascosphaera pollenicola]|nr:hypothetical protein KEM56_003209 [Ascosphaera pollenicola]